MNENEALGHTFSSWEHEWDGYGRDKNGIDLLKVGFKPTNMF